MGRTRLASQIREIFITISEAMARKVPVEEVQAERRQQGISRRQFLRAVRFSNPVTAPRIAIVGGGLAGLTCAYRLKQKGHRAAIFEASSRLGRLLAIAYTCYYGGEAADQSSLNLLYMMGYRGHGNLRMYGPSDERYHVCGDNQQIAERWPNSWRGRSIQERRCRER